MAREGAPQVRGTALIAMPAGLTWRFHHWIYTTSTATLDSYNEYLGPAFTYDQGANGTGRRTAMTVGNGAETLASTSWGYDARGRTVSAIERVTGLPGTGRSFSWAYDSADRVSSSGLPAAHSAVAETVSYSYNAAWQPIQVCTSLGGCYAHSASYRATGEPDAWALGSGLVQNWMYDAAQRPVRVQLGTSGTVSLGDSLGAAAADRFDRQYGYDGAGNVIALTDKRGVVAAQSFDYDARGRLTSWTLGGTTQGYGYDVIGNLTSKGGVTQSYGATGSGTGAGPHQARSVGGSTYSYDLVGNLTSGGGRSIVWTPDHRPASITSGGVTESYLYNADGARVKTSRGGVATYDLGGLWEEDSAGVVRKYYTLAGQAMAVREVSSTANTVSYLQGDHLGSVSLTTNSAGATVSQQEFDPWGKVRSGGVSQTRRNFTGQDLDATGLLFYNARYYDPGIGRFISADTIVPGSNPLTAWPSDATASAAWGTSGNGPANPQDLNRYSYGLNNPVRNTDPTGHCVEIVSCTLEFAAAGAAAGTVAAPGPGTVFGGVAGGAVGFLVGATIVVGAAAGIAYLATRDGEEGGETPPESASEPGPLSVDDYLARAQRVQNGKTQIYEKPGSFDEANRDFDALTQGARDQVKDQGGGVRSAELPGGASISVRPGSSQGNSASRRPGSYPTVQINRPATRPAKVRYVPE